MSEPDCNIFLEKDATLDQRWRAIYLSMQIYHQRRAQVGVDMHTGSLGDLEWTSNRLCIDSEDSIKDRNTIDTILAWYGRQRSLQGATWWYTSPGRPLKLQAYLFARGLSPTFRPHWMWRELDQMRGSSSTGGDFIVRLATVEDYLTAADEECEIAQALSTVVPRGVFHLIACREKIRLGKCLLSITTGEFGIGTLFDMTVIGTERRKGVGSALVQTACEMARDMGCHHVMLNATEMGESVYRRGSFQSMGRTYTWGLYANTLADNAPTGLQVKFLEAVGLGNVNALQSMREELKFDDLREPSLNGLTPFEIAAQCQQPQSATWLVGQGVIPDIISIWDLGWKDRAKSVLAQYPELVERETGLFAETPLHIAVERNDVDLAKVLLTVPNNMDARDSRFRSTPMGWAHHLNRPEMISLLGKYTDTMFTLSLHAELENVLGKEQVR